MQIVAVVFGNFEKNSFNLKFADKPYFYIDPYDCKVDDLALTFVNNDRGCHIVRVVRERVDDAAAMYVTKPLICKIDFDPDALNGIDDRIKDFQRRTEDSRIQREVDNRIKEARGEERNTFLESPVAAPRFVPDRSRQEKLQHLQRLRKKILTTKYSFD